MDTSKLNFPKNLISGGFPLIVYSQGQERIASLGCLVSDGNKVYTLTNRHVTGNEGTVVYTKLGSTLRPIGTSSSKQLGKIKFTDVYKEWSGTNLLVNNDIGLIEIEDVNLWKTEVFGIGQLDTLASLDTSNMTLNLINAPVVGYGAVSGQLQGEVVALFYRYKAIWGVEYVSDFLIGSRGGSGLPLHHGDSGTLWVLEIDGKKCPFAVHWGQHEFMEGGETRKHGYGLATCLSNVCNLLDVDIVRGWNLDQDYTWGKTGHFKIAARACDLASDEELGGLLQANKANIGYSDEQLKDKNSIAKAKSAEFIPLADVPDLWWRYKRFSTEGSNHFADMDEKDNRVMKGKTLLELCADEGNLDIKFWLSFYKQMDEVNPKSKVDRGSGEEKPDPRMGALPFRVWQMYEQMVRSLAQGSVAEFICAGGTMSHYVGDACQPLHVSYLHAGIPGQESKVHSDYEDVLVDRNAANLFQRVNAVEKKVLKGDLIRGGKAAAKLVIELMRSTHQNLPPMKIIETFDNNAGKGKYERAWETLGEGTVKNVANGCYHMAVLWQSAWVEGGGKAVGKNQLGAIDHQDLIELYSNYHFVQSYRLDDPKFQGELT